MATITATKTGNWSDPTVWDLARAPLDGDTVLAQAYTITFDVDVNQPNTVLRATTGNFRHSGTGTRNVTAQANSGTHTAAGLIQNTSSGTLNFTGHIVGGSVSSAYGALNNSTGTLTVTTATGGSGSSAHCALNNSTGTLTVTTATGGSGSYACGALNNSTGTLTVTTATGGSGNSAYGALNSGTGTLTVTTATGGSGSSAHGALNNSTGACIIDEAVGNTYGDGVVIYSNYGVYNAQNTSSVTVKKVTYGTHGQTPTFGRIYVQADSPNNALDMPKVAGGRLNISNDGSLLDFPVEADVRSGTSYKSGANTGTCAVPTAGQVVSGVAVDDTIGTAVLTAAAAAAAVWDAVRSSYATAGTFGATAEWAGASNGFSAADVWAHTTRTLTQAAASVTSAVTGSTITVYRGTTWSITLTGLADNSNYDEVYFSVKKNVNQADTAAYLRVSLGTGLERFNGAAATAGNATLTLPSSTSVTITVDESVTDDAPLMTGLVYDVKGVDNDGNVDILSIGGTFNVEGDVTRAIT